MDGIAVLVEMEVECCRSSDDLEKLAPIGTKSFTSADFFLPRLRFLLEVLREEKGAECKVEVEVDGASVVAVAPADACLPTLAVRDSLSSIFGRSRVTSSTSVLPLAFTVRSRTRL